ncbi:hypothetical protein A1F95_10613 [Pyrenophora tritici-repentis]|nr:hypothetical protein A1F95_10613 [Pyrenophora tritici-repentis]
MDTLPQELINKIVLYLERYPGQEQAPILEQCGHHSKLPQYATISSHWKEAVEFVTFHRLHIKSHELSQLEAMVTGNRIKYLTRLSFEIILAEYSEESCGRVESTEEQQCNDEAFTQAIADLFSLVRKWEDAGLVHGLRLQLRDVCSPTDCRDRNQIDLEMSQRKRGIDIFEKRWVNSYIHLSRPEMIPTLSSIVHFHLQGHVSRKVALVVGPGLAAVLPNLQSFYWEFGEVDDKSINVESRASFARVLEQTKLDKCSAAEITFHHQRYPVEDHRVAEPSRIPIGALYDPFSASLRIFSQNLTSLILDGFVDSTLFWPSSHEISSIPSWPNLRKLIVLFNMAAPSSEWYFDGTPGEIVEQFRDHEDAKILDPLVTAFAKAVQKMPLLEQFLLETELGHDIGYWDISYHAPGIKADWDENEDDAKVRRVYYSVGEVWRPDDFIAEAFRRIGRDSHGPELIERFHELRTWPLESPWSWF